MLELTFVKNTFALTDGSIVQVSVAQQSTFTPRDDAGLTLQATEVAIIDHWYGERYERAAYPSLEAAYAAIDKVNIVLWQESQYGMLDALRAACRAS